MKKERTRLNPPDPDMRAAAPRQGGRKNDRRCIASGVSLSAGDPAIRFVLGPDGVPVPDLAEKLPGRGAWVAADRALLAKALEKGLFARAFRQPVSGQDAASIAQRIETALRDRALNALGLARRAGKMVIGFEKTRAAVQKGTANAYIHASDAAADGVSKILQPAGPEISVWHPFPGIDLDRAIGEANVVHLALTDAGTARRFGREAARFLAFAGDDAGLR